MEVEKHERAFRGCWCPVELIDLLEKGEVNSTEFALLLTIDSFVQSSGDDCFASLAYLANRIGGLRDEAVSRMVNRLKGMGLIIQTKFDGRRRYMRTCWSRFKGCEKTQGCIGENRKAGLRKNATIGELRLEDNKSHPADGTPRPIAMHPRWTKYATRLKDAITTVKKINHTSKVKGWAKSFALLHTQDKVEVPRIKAALKWYCDRLPTHHGTPYFLDIQSGAAFREKFDKLESAIKRAAANDDNNDSGDTDNTGPDVHSVEVADDGSPIEWD